MDEAEQLCDRVGIIDGGRLVTCGSPAELTLNAAADETRFSAPPGLDRASLGAALGVDAHLLVEERPGEYVLAAEATPVLIAELAIWFRDQDLRLAELRAGRRTLEEVFLLLTRSGRR
jgi:ABC-2 type transport system ATP-binding protein